MCENKEELAGKPCTFWGFWIIACTVNARQKSAGSYHREMGAWWNKWSSTFVGNHCNYQ